MLLQLAHASPEVLQHLFPPPHSLQQRFQLSLAHDAIDELIALVRAARGLWRPGVSLWLLLRVSGVFRCLRFFITTRRVGRFLRWIALLWLGLIRLILRR